jgi:hypothetical protein
MLDDFFAWAEGVFARVRDVRGPVASAFGYVIRQKAALRRFLDDGRLRLENNSSERELRAIATGRRAWLFMASDDHAQAAANIFSLVASCRLHGLDVEAYFTDILRVMPYWPYATGTSSSRRSTGRAHAHASPSASSSCLSAP